MATRLLRPAPELHPLTWVGLRRVCGLLRVGSRVAEARDLAGSGEVTIPDARAFVTTATATMPAAAQALPLELVAAHVLATLREAVREASDEAAAYGAARVATMPEAYRLSYAEWSAPEATAAGGGEDPPARTVEAVLAGDSPAAWAPLYEWPLAKCLCWLEDRAIHVFLSNLDAATREASGV